MPINWRTDYGIRLLYELAAKGEGVRATVREISESAEVPYDYARTIVRDLVAKGLLESRRGVGGGVQLARPATQITLLDVFRALDEPPSLAICTEARGVCARAGECPMHNVFWRQLDGLILDYLGKTDFGTVLAAGEPPSLD